MHSNLSSQNRFLILCLAQDLGVLFKYFEKVSFNLSDDYFKTYDEKIRKLTRDELQKMSAQVIKPDQLTCFVVGDKSKIINSLKETGYEIIEVDPDGNVLKD